VHLHKGLPDFSFLENKHPLNLSVLRKQFVEEVVRNDVTRFIVDANE
jgi:hypothetical protein